MPTASPFLREKDFAKSYPPETFLRDSLGKWEKLGTEQLNFLILTMTNFRNLVKVYDSILKNTKCSEIFTVHSGSR